MRRRTLSLAAVMAVGAVASTLFLLSSGSSDALTPADPATVYNPVAAGEPLPGGYRTLLDRDQIEPVYHPEFTAASGVDWPADSLVIGVAGPRTAKAYPITHLNSHEMVLDTLDDDPILVSW